MCYQALDLGFQLGLKGVEVEGDSRSVIQKLQEKKEDRSEIAVYIEDSKKMSLSCRYCAFRFLNREANKVAHLIATEDIKNGENTYLLQRISSGAEATVMDDRRWTKNVQVTKVWQAEEESGGGYMRISDRFFWWFLFCQKDCV